MQRHTVQSMHFAGQVTCNQFVNCNPAAFSSKTCNLVTTKNQTPPGSCQIRQLGSYGCHHM
jgi:hypothetical protein